MSWLTLLLLGVGLADLLAASRPEPRWAPPALGALAATVAGVLAGLTTLPDVLALLGVAAAVLAWGAVTTSAEASTLQARRTLALLGVPGFCLLALSGLASPIDGALGRWITWMQLPAVSALSPGAVLLLVALALVNTVTANRLVRLVLIAIRAQPPRLPGEETSDAPASERLRGGRLLGPMERLLVLGFGAAGYLEAAAVVVAAKGLLRFPELQAAARAEPRAVDEVTEYFLVGTFTSLLIGLGSVVLLA